MLGGWILLYHIYFSSIFVLPKFGYIVRPCGSEIFLKSEVFFKPNPKSLILKKLARNFFLMQRNVQIED